jgi:hypothetical protein
VFASSAPGSDVGGEGCFLSPSHPRIPGPPGGPYVHVFPVRVMWLCKGLWSLYVVGSGKRVFGAPEEKLGRSIRGWRVHDAVWGGCSASWCAPPGDEYREQQHPAVNCQGVSLFGESKGTMM